MGSLLFADVEVSVQALNFPNEPRKPMQLSVLLENINSLERAQEFAARINDKTAGAPFFLFVQWPDLFSGCRCLRFPRPDRPGFAGLVQAGQGTAGEWQCPALGLTVDLCRCAAMDAVLQVPESVDSYLKSEDATDYLEVIQAISADVS